MSAVTTAESKPTRQRSLGMWSCGMLLSATIAGGFGCHRPSISPAPALPVIAQTDEDPQIAAAIEQAKSRVLADPQSGPAWGGLGSILMAHKFHQEAMQCFAQAGQLQPKEPRWPYYEGVILLSWDAHAAIPKLERAVELVPDSPIAPRLRLADALLEQGQFDRAEKHLNILPKEHPTDAYVLLGMGKMALARGQLNDAFQFLVQSAASPQTARSSAALIAGILHRMGKAEAAAEASSHVAQLPADPEMPDPFLREIGELQTGMQAWLARVERLFKANKASEGLALLEKTVATYPNSAAPWRMLGQAQMSQGNPAAAEKSLRKAAELSPGESATYYQLGTLLGAQGRFAEAAISFRKALELRPNDSSAYFHLGQCFTRAGDVTNAIDAYQAAIRYDPTFPGAHTQLGILLSEQGRYDEAIQALSRAAKLDPTDTRAAQNLERVKRAHSQ